jgi:porin
VFRPERYGYYIQGLQQITGTGSVDPIAGWKGIRGLTAFFNFVQADRATATIDNQVSVGIHYAAPFPSRPKDHVGLAFGRTRYNSRAAQGLLLQNPGVAKPGAENATELYYSAAALSWLTLRPDLQYITHPGGLPHVRAVFVLGARVVVSF